MRCTLDHCNRAAVATGLCSFHYGQRYRGQEFTEAPHVEPTKCAVTLCDKYAFSKGWCSSHYGANYRFGVTTEQMNSLMAGEERCAICGAGDNLMWDHDHSCCKPRKGNYRTCGACLRGVLCGRCNTTLGLVRDDIGHLRRLIAYLGE